MTTTLDELTSAVKAAVRTTVGCYTIQRENAGAVWSGTDLKEMETSLAGSLLKFTPAGQAGPFYATVVAGNRAELTLSYSGGTGPFTRMTGQELEEAGLRHCIMGVLSDADGGAGSNAHLVTVGGRDATLTPIGTHEGGLKNIAVAIDGGQPQTQAMEAAVQSTSMRWHSWRG